MELGCFPVSAAMVYRQPLGHHCRWLTSPSVTLSVFLTLSPSTCHLPLRPPPFSGTQKEKKRKQKSIVAYYRKIIISHTEVALLSVLQIYDYENRIIHCTLFYFAFYNWYISQPPYTYFFA